MRKILTGLLALTALPAAAQELDAVLPAAIAGYGTPFAVTAEHKPPRPEFSGFEVNGLSIAPALALGAGYDSAPNAAAASSRFTAAPSLLLADPLLGLGVFATVNTALYPGNRAQDTSGFTLGAGERAVLARETITISAVYERAQETGFTLGTIAAARPLGFTVRDFRARDEISLGMFTLTPDASATAYSFPSPGAQNRRDTREGLTTAYLPPGPLQFLLRLHATQSVYETPAFNAATYQLLAGLVDTASGLWSFSALGGVAQRQPRFGPALTAPVLELALDWMPGDLDKLRLTLAREIDDPDEVSAAPYTLSEAKLSLSHEYMRNVTINLTAKAASAAYLHSFRRESLFTADAETSWRLGPELALDADYAFNDRQANYLPAANEHVVTFGMTWTP
ncbi:hypothetical protein GCM10010909_09500 [Acidocella aquatica]|uniref:Beta-barrel porin 2 n=1 Tax=Acidocella aquatica TaxID=1922313 RepID=A0ABQ6A4S1_9PROT|nr:outer membrane beta-barrel protein [Acidocella aquatica]GLR66270.1 hypothetical protein GCM10010909_09500 [Acidocella aquatica]